MGKTLFSLVLVVLFCSQSHGESSVWKAQKDGSVLFLGGTFHLLRQSDFPLPEEFQEAYQESELLVFETDLGQFNDASTQQRLISKAVYADGSTVEQHLSAQTYAILQEYCTSRSIPLEQFNYFKPSILAVTLTLLELAKLGVMQEGVDTYYYQQANQDGKAVEGLESIDEQIHFVVSMGEGNEDAFITHSIDSLESIETQYESMVAAWRSGDVEGLDKLLVAEMQTKMPKLYKELLIDRNDNWLPLIDTYQQTPAVEFILVGAAHLVGEKGIVAALRKKGYRVEKL